MTLPIDEERLTMAVTVLRGAAGQARLYADEAPTVGWQDWNEENADAFDTLATWLEAYPERETLSFEDYAGMLEELTHDASLPECGDEDCSCLSVDG